MSVSLAAKLAILIFVLAGSLLVMLYRVHKATQFSTIDPRGGLGDLPAENAPYKNMDASYLHEKSQSLRRMAREKKEKEEKIKRETEETKKPMNILLFYADDWRHDTLGAAGNPIVKTPVLDALAEEGMRFTENCVTTSICWVSRATLYSGQYLARHHFEMLGRGRTIMVDGEKKGDEIRGAAE